MKNGWPICLLLCSFAGACLQVSPGWAQALKSPIPHKEGRDYYEYPDAALVRELGAIPKGPCDPKASQICQGAPGNQMDAAKGGYPMDLPGLGIPLGGIGAGSFMVNQAGTFGPWTFGGDSTGDKWENRILPQAAFHVREQVGDQPAVVRTLATNGPKDFGADGPVLPRTWGDPLPAWKSLQRGEASYAALYPFGWISYPTFKADISTRFFSPIVPREDRRTSLPVAYFDIRVANHTNSVDRISVMLTMPNVAAHVGTAVPSIRKGLANRWLAGDKVEGLSMSADDAANTPDEKNSEWTLAIRRAQGQTVTYATSWNAEGDGSDVYLPFTNEGKLDDIAIDSSNSAGAVAVSMVLQPGQTTTFHFALSWDFPQISYNKGQTVWMRRYTAFYGGRETPDHNYVQGSYPFHQSFRIAEDALMHHDENVAAVEKWWHPLATDTAYPKTLRTAALNELYQVAFKMPLWESGLFHNTVAPDDWQQLATGIAGAHLFFTPDAAAGGNGAMGNDTSTYCYLAYNLFFPTLERDLLRATARAIILDPDGSFGQWVVASPYTQRDPKGKPTPDNQLFLDVPSKIIFRSYAYAHLNRDEPFLREVYPAMKMQMDFLMATVRPGEHLPHVADHNPTVSFLPPFPNTYDTIPVVGRDVYSSELYLLSLEVLIEAGGQIGETPELLDKWRRELAAARVEFEKTFWDPEQHWYRYTEYKSGSAAHVDTFFAQHVAERLGLPDLVDLSHYREQLLAHYDEFMVGRDSKGAPVGPRNMILPPGVTTWPALTTLFGTAAPLQENDVWAGSAYFDAATWLRAGSRFKNKRLRDEGVAMGTAVADEIWQDPDNGFQFNDPDAWKYFNVALYTYPGYVRPLAIWELMDAIKPLGYLPPAARSARTKR